MRIIAAIALLFVASDITGCKDKASQKDFDEACKDLKEASSTADCAKFASKTTKERKESIKKMKAAADKAKKGGKKDGDN